MLGAAGQRKAISLYLLGNTSFYKCLHKECERDMVMDFEL